jgi:hypothetical protein
MRFLRVSFFLLPAVLFGGCRLDDHSPTVDVFGSYFPAWMECIVLGIIITLVVRQLLIGLKLDDHLRPAALIYLCLTIFFTLGVWLAFFQN